MPSPTIPEVCNGCGKPLLLENLYVDDGCPCNTPRGVNFTPEPCHTCGTDNCVKPGHRLHELFGIPGLPGLKPPTCHILDGNRTLCGIDYNGSEWVRGRDSYVEKDSRRVTEMPTCMPCRRAYHEEQLERFG